MKLFLPRCGYAAGMAFALLLLFVAAGLCVAKMAPCCVAVLEELVSSLVGGDIRRMLALLIAVLLEVTMPYEDSSVGKRVSRCPPPWVSGFAKMALCTACADLLQLL